jgi:AcrR family transcriptional regulator
MARTRSDISERLIPVARAHFLRDGVEGASLRNIAKDAGTSIGMIYYYYPAKDDLFLAVIEPPYTVLLERLSAAFRPDRPFPEQVELFYGIYGELTEVERQTLRLMLREALGSAERLGRLISRFRTGHIPMLLQAVAGGQRSGSLDPEIHPLITLAAMGAIGVLPQVLLDAVGPKLPIPLPNATELPRQLAKIFIRAFRPETG